MATTLGMQAPASLLRTTFRRSLTLGRVFIVVGIIYVLVLATSLSLSSPASFASAFPLLLPIFAVLGSMGGLMVFGNDRTKGVFEYLIAYGISPRRLFINVLVVSLLLESAVLALVLGIGLTIFVASGHTISATLLESLGEYSVPMSYASAAFAAIVGMLWTALSSPRSGINSPVGFVPFVGIAPSILVLALVGFLATQGFTDTDLVFGAAVGGVTAAVVLLLSLVDRLMPRERLLSPV